MKIGIVASIWIKCPPQDFGFGAQEYLAWALAEGLKKRGHEVTLFASGDSSTSVRLRSVTPNQVSDMDFPDNKIKDYFELMNLSEAYKMVSEFDVIHNHLLPYGLLFSPLQKIPTVHTLHHAINQAKADVFLYHKYKNEKFVSISLVQREIMPELNYVENVYNGVDTNYFSYKEKPSGDYLLFLGRLKRYKGIHTAIFIAQKLGYKLKIAAPIPNKNQPDYEETISYWKNEIEPNIGGNIEHIDSVKGVDKVKLIQNARLLVFPLEREEPFGMTVIEAASCGLPTVVFSRGAMPELIKNQETGYLINKGDMQAMTETVKSVCQMPENEYLVLRKKCRDHVVSNFDINLMVDNYEKVYVSLL